MDPKVTRLMRMVNVNNINDFSNIATYMTVARLRIRYADSTVEDYVWRLLRVIRRMPQFPAAMTRRYYILWLSVGGHH
jgi:hypothetical protein